MPDWLFAGQSARRVVPVENGARLLALGERLEVWNLQTRKLERIQKLDSLGLHADSESVAAEMRRRMIGGFRTGDTLFGIVASGEITETFDLRTGRRGVALGRGEAEIMADFQALVTRPGMTREEFNKQGERLRAEVFPRGGSMDASPDGKHLLVADPDSRAFAAAIWSLECGRVERLLGPRSKDGPPRGWHVSSTRGAWR